MDLMQKLTAFEAKYGDWDEAACVDKLVCNGTEKLKLVWAGNRVGSLRWGRPMEGTVIGGAIKSVGLESEIPWKA